LLSACGTPPLQPSDKHILREDAQAAAGTSPLPSVRQNIPLPPPKAAPKVETYSVVVTNVPAQEILFALARDAKVNLDIYPGIQGNVTLNAINQTLPQILERISKQIDMRYELDGPNLEIMPDTPFLKQYKIDYVNMTRDTDSAISTNATVSSGATSSGTTTTMASGSSSTIAIKDVSRNRFWDTLVQNIKDILHETDKILPAGSSETVVQQSSAISTSGTGIQQTGGKKSKTVGIESSPNPANLQEGATTVTRTNTFREAASVIANPETGIITVRATGKQHEKIQEFIDQVMASARRQVMIEATIAEVTLNNNYQQGINWQSLRTLRSPGTAGFSVSQSPTGLVNGVVPDPFATANKGFLLNYVAPVMGISATLNLLETFGNVKVLSSPKLSVLNNQTAMLKVVDNIVYFEVKSDSTIGQVNTDKTFTTTAKSVAVGLVMSVTPQISDAGMITLNVRPTISRVTGYKTDPNPDIPATSPNLVPQIQTREMESVLRLTNGEIAVMGGLMEDKIDYNTDAIPGLGRMAGIGNLFRNRDDTNTKTELVIFLKPTVIQNPSLNGDYQGLRNQMPGREFFKDDPAYSPRSFPGSLVP
jgi:general secretion pathway protein D